MKRIFILALLCLSISSYGQDADLQSTLTSGTASSTTGLGGSTVGGSAVYDTITNTGTDTMYLEVTGSKSAVAFQYIIDKVSGTVGGTIILSGSLENRTGHARNLNYSLINSYSVTDADAIAAALTYPANYYKVYRVIITGTGTMVAGFKVNALYRR